MEYKISLDSLKKTLTKQPDKLPMFGRVEESWSKFTIKDTGIVFYYSNYDNGIYDKNKNPLSVVAEPDAEYYATIEETRSRVKSDKPFWIRILLGHACNYSCSYCMQKDIGNPDERAKITTTEYFIEQLSKLDMSRLQKIDLWGGETLLYWKTIEEIMRKFDREGLEWYIPTNGTPLQMKHVEFFKTLKGKVGISISHDGPAQEQLRGEEFLHKKVDVLKAMIDAGVQFSFNPVISKTNYDLFEINKFFYDFCVSNEIDHTKIGLNWVVGHNHDYENIHNSADHVIGGESLEHFGQILNVYMDKCIEQFIHGKDNNLFKNSLFTTNMGVIPYTKTLKKQILPTSSTSCGVDDEGVLSVDMKGNVRTCPHTDESFIGGHLEKLDEVRLKNIDLDRYEKHCKSCSVFRLCKSNCPIEVPDDVFFSNCAIEKVYHRAVQETAFMLLFGSEVVLHETEH